MQIISNRMHCAKAWVELSSLKSLLRNSPS